MCIHCLLFHSNLCWYVKYSLMLSVTGFGVGLLCVPFFILKVPVVVDVTIFLSSFSYFFKEDHDSSMYDYKHNSKSLNLGKLIQ